jgi:ATP-GRASP peptide maturase of grasp-with-spasm system
MILIVSHDSYDEPTNNIIDWLHFYDANYTRMNGEEYTPKKNFTIDLTNNCLKKDDDEILNPKEVSVVLYRRWFNPPIRNINFGKYLKNNYGSDEALLIECYEGFLKNELSAYTNGIFSLFRKKTWIPEAQIARGGLRGGLNKIDVLLKAKELGLLIPETIITTSKKELLMFYNENNTLITKPIFEVAPIIYKNSSISMFTKEVELEDIEKFPDQFYPSLFQKRIDKLFEIRAFIYKDKIYSIAIFSQDDNQTKTDFRNYNYSKPNRNVPFKLPKSIESKLFELIKEVKLNTGSIDLIANTNGELVLLEINPVGQFGMVSVGLNYSLERMIAEDLIQTDIEYVRN